MSTAWIVSSTLKAAVLLAASGLGALVLRRSSAAARHQMWTLGVVAALAVPVLAWILPAGFSVHAPMLAAPHELHAPALVVGGAAPGESSSSVPWLAIAWASGALIVLGRLARGQLAARRILRASEPATAESWIAAQRSAEQVVGVVGVGVRRSEGIASPMTIGALHPRVLLPAAADGWPVDRLRAVLVHELGHVRRRDLLIQLAAQVACALHWWNPLAWLAAARLRIEREHACDDLVLAAGTRASSYATDLLEVSRAVSRSHVARAAACMAEDAGIEHRLRRLLDARIRRGPLGAGARLLAAGVALAAAATVACTSASASLPAETSTALSIGAPTIEYGVRGPFEQPTFARATQPSPEDARYLALVTAEVARNAPALEACYERRAHARPGLAGEIQIHWTIATDGTVPDQCVTSDTVGDTAVTDCVNELVSTSKFPAPRGVPVSVVFPFVFRGI